MTSHAAVFLDLLTETFEPNLRSQGAGRRADGPGSRRAAERRRCSRLVDRERPGRERRSGSCRRSSCTGRPTTRSVGVSWLDDAPSAAGDDLDCRASRRTPCAFGPREPDAHRPATLAARRSRTTSARWTCGVPVARRRGRSDHLLLRMAITARHVGDLERAARLASEALGDARAAQKPTRRSHGPQQPRDGRVRPGEIASKLRLAHEAASVAADIGFTWWRGVTLFATAEWLLQAARCRRSEARARGGARGPRVGARSREHADGARRLRGNRGRRGDAARAGTLWGAVEAGPANESRGRRPPMR